MSKDGPESFPPAGPGGPEPSPEPGGPDPSLRDVTLREQVMEIINYVLADPSPEREWARHQLRELLAEYPDEPERALLEHLIIIRELAAPLEDED